MLVVAEPERRAILLWRIAAGAILHFGPVAFLVAVPLLLLIEAPAQALTADYMRLALRYCALVGAALMLLACLVIPIAALVDATLARLARSTESAAQDGIAESRRRLTAAADTARRFLDHGSAVQVGTLAADAWDHEDARYQALARDLGRIVDTAATALRSAAADRRPLISAQASLAMAHIGDELAALNADRAHGDEAAAQAATLYVARRYGPSDFAVVPTGTGVNS